ncbi:hypothetical protein [uncultured Rhodoblastus sp.]|uniref:hypothetical protein n=1 Tax=uncultured Rhodoblastus sp. TaxID=543037 RepID=UPI0025FE6C99|nr:hypothetical protein [uncultured Rhodoblastus sp.]
MALVDNNSILTGLQRAAVAFALTVGLIAGAADAAPIAPASIRSGPIEAPIEKAQVVVHHRRPAVRHHHRRPVVVHHHHHRRPVVVHHHHRRHQVCWWSHGRRICRWR